MVSGDKYARGNFWKHQGSAKEARAEAFRLGFLIEIANLLLGLTNPHWLNQKLLIDTFFPYIT